MKTTRLSLGQILKENGIITEEQLNNALKQQKRLSVRLGEVLTKMGYTNPEDIVHCLAEQFEFQVVNPMAVSISEDVLNSVPKDVVKKHKIIPIAKQNGLLVVAISDPLNIHAQEDLRFTLDTNVECVLATEKNIEDAIKKYYDKEQVVSFDGFLDGFTSTTTDITQSYEFATGTEKEAEAPIVKLVSYLIDEAVKLRASDIHIEPLLNKIRIRFRIDGVCQEMHSISKSVLEALISRLKILANMDITEKRKPKDGRIGLITNEKPVDIRVSTIPTTSGESAVMRILEKSTVLMKLKNMGFSKHDYKNFKNILKKPNGIILVTGPTGSGKSTTLYAALNEINSAETKLITVEDPIEYNLHGINQCEVNKKIGLSFPNILRSVLRQDPNVIVIGEIRDVDTAEIAVSSALTGHLVLSTLHTNDAPSAITRLNDMGIKPFLISSSVQAIMAQRLVRVICPKCKTQGKINKNFLMAMGLNTALKALELNIDNLEDAALFYGKGCTYCNHTGYRGRAGIFEFMFITPELREAIYKRAGINELKKIALSNGMTTLMEDGLRLVRAQVTTLEEVMRVCVQNE